jgi:hypothetical protein
MAKKQRAWERMADHKGVYDASYLFVASACTGTRMLARSCWMSATMLSLHGVSQAGYIQVHQYMAAQPINRIQVTEHAPLLKA